MQGMQQLEPTTADEWVIFPENTNGRIIFDVRSHLVLLLLVNQDATGKNQRLRALARGRQPTFDQQFIKPQLHRARLACRTGGRFDLIPAAKSHSTQCTLLESLCACDLSSSWASFSTSLFTFALKTRHPNRYDDHRG